MRAYDRVVRELLTLDEADSARPGLVSPSGFFAASEHKPENLAANATRVFLGVNLDARSATTIRSRAGLATSSGRPRRSSHRRVTESQARLG